MGLPDIVLTTATTLASSITTSSPGLLQALYLRGSLCWGEWFPSSDLDFTAVLTRRPDERDLSVLEAVHEAINESVDFNVDGFYCIDDDLRRSPRLCPPLPVAHERRFSPTGTLDVNPVSWHELSERGITIFGKTPGELEIYTDEAELRAFTRDNLATYWRGIGRQLQAGWFLAGRKDETAAWCVLGVARLHHLLATGELTSKSGAGRYILERLDPRWHPIAREALRAREAPGAPTAYTSLTDRGRDTRDFVLWAVEDGLARPDSGQVGVDPQPAPGRSIEYRPGPVQQPDDRDGHQPEHG